jgi:hypothetical protein
VKESVPSPVFLLDMTELVAGFKVIIDVKKLGCCEMESPSKEERGITAYSFYRGVLRGLDEFIPIKD